MTTFQRARSDEQRAVRSRAILDTAAAMLTEMPVAELSLNELSRRVGLAKSNVLRYFESREAVLLELLHTEAGSWLGALDHDLQAAVDPQASVRERCEQVARAYAGSVVGNPLLCDLISAQASVLERNVSTALAIKYKHAGHDDLARIVSLLNRHLPELGEQDATQFAIHSFIVIGALWPHAHPSEAMRCAYEAEPELADTRLDFGAAVTDMAAVVLAGLFARR